jgi:hypothetical protein
MRPELGSLMGGSVWFRHYSFRACDNILFHKQMHLKPRFGQLTPSSVWYCSSNLNEAHKSYRVHDVCNFLLFVPHVTWRVAQVTGGVAWLALLNSTNAKWSRVMRSKRKGGCCQTLILTCVHPYLSTNMLFFNLCWEPQITKHATRSCPPYYYIVQV